FQACQQSNNTTNFGWFIKLESYAGGTGIYRKFYSSNEATAAYRPKVDFRVALAIPEAPDYCDQVFAKLERHLRGVRYKPYLSHLYFFYDEEYNTPDESLNYKVFSVLDPINPVLDPGDQALT